MGQFSPRSLTRWLSSALHQHWAQASARDRRRTLPARAANTGISGIVDPHGRDAAVAFVRTHGVDGPRAAFDWPNDHARIGDAFAYGCVALMIVTCRAATQAGLKPCATNSPRARI
jgi:apolipoprotein N-acyltransferase